jgi:hypothetical protein
LPIFLINAGFSRDEEQAWCSVCVSLVPTPVVGLKFTEVGVRQVKDLEGASHSY